jgi:hypothetical protein
MNPKDLSIYLDRTGGVKPRPCGNWCDNYRFPHLNPACVLSDVYSVKKGEPCYNYIEKTA